MLAFHRLSSVDQLPHVLLRGPELKIEWNPSSLKKPLRYVTSCLYEIKVSIFLLAFCRLSGVDHVLLRELMIGAQAFFKVHNFFWPMKIK